MRNLPKFCTNDPICILLFSTYTGGHWVSAILPVVLKQSRLTVKYFNSFNFITLFNSLKLLIEYAHYPALL